MTWHTFELVIIPSATRTFSECRSSLCYIFGLRTFHFFDFHSLEAQNPSDINPTWGSDILRGAGVEPTTFPNQTEVEQAVPSAVTHDGRSPDARSVNGAVYRR